MDPTDPNTLDNYLLSLSAFGSLAPNVPGNPGAAGAAPGAPMNIMPPQQQDVTTPTFGSLAPTQQTNPLQYYQQIMRLLNPQQNTQPQPLQPMNLAPSRPMNLAPPRPMNLEPWTVAAAEGSRRAADRWLAAPRSPLNSQQGNG
jgi:hypothetical protein